MAIDSTESTRYAVEHAVGFAKQYQVQPHPLTVHHPELVACGKIQVYVPRAKMKELQRLCSLDILRAAEELVRSPQVPLTSEVITGEIAHAILSRADELGCAGSSWDATV